MTRTRGAIAAEAGMLTLCPASAWPAANAAAHNVIAKMSRMFMRCLSPGGALQNEGVGMDLGISGRRAIVCASSKHFGYLSGRNVHLDGGTYPALV